MLSCKGDCTKNEVFHYGFLPVNVTKSTVCAMGMVEGMVKLPLNLKLTTDTGGRIGRT